MTLKECVLYARVSSREQKEEGFSIEAQFRLLHEYAPKHSLKIVKEFIDIESATNPGRKNFGEMVKFLKQSRTCRILLVEKTDRLYRNNRDPLTIEDLDIEVHFVKDNEIVSKDSRSGVKFIHDIRIAMARNYSANLREEVIKGMLEKCRQGFYPGCAPYGYMSDKAARRLVVHPEKSKVVRLAFELYATGNYSIVTLKTELQIKTKVQLSRRAVENILKNRFYIGSFEWRDESFQGNHPLFIDADLFAKVQAILNGFSKPRGRHQEIAFRGIFRCQHCGCMITGERKKEIYVYYRCTCGRGPCSLPRFREEEISDRLRTVMEAIRLPEDVARMIETTMHAEQDQTQRRIDAQRTQLKYDLNSLQAQRNTAYTDKLNGEISVDFWREMQTQWADEELAIKAQLSSLEDVKTAQRVENLHSTLELAQIAHSKCLTGDPFKQADLAKTVLLNCSMDAVTLYPTYRKPFDLIVRRAKNEEWSGRRDSNPRPSAPKAGPTIY